MATRGSSKDCESYEFSGRTGGEVTCTLRGWMARRQHGMVGEERVEAMS